MCVCYGLGGVGVVVVGVQQVTVCLFTPEVLV